MIFLLVILGIILSSWAQNRIKTVTEYNIQHLIYFNSRNKVMCPVADNDATFKLLR